MKFLDEAKIYLKAAMAATDLQLFGARNIVEFGGPSGGDGGRGGFNHF